MMPRMYARAKKHFKKSDPILYRAAREIELEELATSTNLFRDIVWTIVGQQLSARAADAIFERLIQAFPSENLGAVSILKKSDEELRARGLSMAKARAIKAFAEAVHREELLLDSFDSLGDVEIVTQLTRVKGIGPWTAEMVLMFSLGRPDIFSQGDLGLRKGIMELYQFKKSPSERRLRAMLAAWSPYRTYAARILWKISDRKTARIGRTRAEK